jgi:hypothetical protein
VRAKEFEWISLRLSRLVMGMGQQSTPEKEMLLKRESVSGSYTAWISVWEIEGSPAGSELEKEPIRQWQQWI